MRSNRRRINNAFLLIAGAVLFVSPSESVAQTCTPLVDLCCGNGVCDPNESRLDCPSDCSQGCNFDGVCEPGAGEDSSNCSSDCQPACVPQGCNGRCGAADDGCNATIDCGVCGPVCGDGS